MKWMLTIILQETRKILVFTFFFSSMLLLAACSSTVVVTSQEHSKETYPLVVSPNLSPTSTPTPSPSPTSLPSPTATLTALTPYPPSHYIGDINGHKQYFPLGCEAGAAVDWAAYFGIHINEFEFQYKVPQSDNPDFGFVGGVMGPWGQVPPYSYGTHAGPIAEVLRQYGIPAQGVKGFTLDQLKEQIAKDQPVIAWVIGNVVGGIPYEYTDTHGNKTIVAAYEHVIIVTGYNEKTIRYINNGSFYEVPTEVFLNSWKILGNMVVYREE